MRQTTQLPQGGKSHHRCTPGQMSDSEQRRQAVHPHPPSFFITTWPTFAASSSTGIALQTSQMTSGQKSRAHLHDRTSITKSGRKGAPDQERPYHQTLASRGRSVVAPAPLLHQFFAKLLGSLLLVQPLHGRNQESVLLLDGVHRVGRVVSSQ